MVHNNRKSFHRSPQHNLFVPDNGWNRRDGRLAGALHVINHQHGGAAVGALAPVKGNSLIKVKCIYCITLLTILGLKLSFSSVKF